VNDKNLDGKNLDDENLDDMGVVSPERRAFMNTAPVTAAAQDHGISGQITAEKRLRPRTFR
jgi:hypothetical protein